MKFTGTALTRLFADKVAFTATSLPYIKAADFTPNLNNFSGKFMAGDLRNRNRFLGPFIPVPNMDIRAANARFMDTDQHVIRLYVRDWSRL